MAELARLGRVSRARITQVMDLLMLAPEIQDEVLTGGVEVPLKMLLRVGAAAAWEEQRTRWRLGAVTGPHQHWTNHRTGSHDVQSESAEGLGGNHALLRNANVEEQSCSDLE